MDRVVPKPRAEFAANRLIIERLVAAFGDSRENDALSEIEAVLAKDNENPAALYGLCLLALRHQEVLPALQALLHAHQRDPGEPIYAELLALLYDSAGNYSSAGYFAKLSASLGIDAAVRDLLPPSLPSPVRLHGTILENPYLNQATALAAARRQAEAIKQYEIHLAFFPDQIDARRGLSRCLLQTDHPAQALAVLTGLRSDGLASAGDLSMLGQAYAALGEFAAAETCHLEAMAMSPRNLEIGCARLADAVCDPTRDEAALFALARDWGASIGGAGADARERRTIVPFGGRRLRVGYLASATRDPRDLGVLARVAASGDPQRFEIYLYGHRSIEEPHNSLLRGCYDEWHDISAHDAAALAALVEHDGIDILIDIGGHGAPCHLAAMELRPAPLQVSWLGNPVTLGLVQIDAELTLPNGIYCYEPAPPPQLRVNRTGTVRFGADLAISQLYPDLIDCWSQILAQVPGATLALRDRNFVAGGMVDRLIELFSERGIADRIHIIDGDGAAFYGDVDVALAPFVAINPHDAAAALRAGVPVVALAGVGRQRRLASTLLDNVGLGQFVVADADAYIALAAGLAVTPGALDAARAAIAESLGTSPVFNPDEFSISFEAALLDIAGLSP
ncbi:MAG: hypothetical protein WCK65_15715 [Rhodospirillaceae bacterium]